LNLLTKKEGKNFKMENEEPGKKQKIARFCKECIRVVKVTKKPTNFEFKTIVKVSGLGLLIIGFLGFLFAMGKELLL
jgi:protein transport protein SEC61 subunit gamma and related proteins